MVEALHLHHADAAGALQAQVGVVAQAGDVDAQLLGGLEDGGPRGHLDGLLVDGEVDHGSVIGSFLWSGCGRQTRSTASNRQTSKHWPHFTQRSWSMTWASLRVPVMHSTGQLRAQTVQPMQLSGLIS